MKLWLENKKKQRKKYDLENKAQQREHEQNLGVATPFESKQVISSRKIKSKKSCL